MIKTFSRQDKTDYCWHRLQTWLISGCQLSPETSHRRKYVSVHRKCAGIIPTWSGQLDCAEKNALLLFDLDCYFIAGNLALQDEDCMNWKKNILRTTINSSITTRALNNLRYISSAVWLSVSLQIIVNGSSYVKGILGWSYIVMHRLRVFPLSLSPLRETRKNPREKKCLREFWG